MSSSNSIHHPQEIFNLPDNLNIPQKKANKIDFMANQVASPILNGRCHKSHPSTVTLRLLPTIPEESEQT